MRSHSGNLWDMIEINKLTHRSEYLGKLTRDLANKAVMKCEHSRAHIEIHERAGVVGIA